LCYGRSNAKSVTLSFWAKSKVAGNYGVTLYQQDGSEMIGGVYTLVADTWKKVEITFAGNTGSNIVNDNGQGIQIKWGLIIKSDGDYVGTDNTSWGAYASGKLMHGHTAVWGTSTSHDFYLTGVQLELGSSATPFEHRSYGDELARCMRYYQVIVAITMWGNGFGRVRSDTSKILNMINLQVPMRETPNVITFPTVGQASGNITYLNGEGYPSTHGTINETWATKTQVGCSGTGFSAGGAANETRWAYATGNCYFKFQSEI
jgi:hypothetical protein